jgi:formamidopyrimidine-DNA glycosylase
VFLPMLAGRFSVSDNPKGKSPGDLAVAFSLADGRELLYRDDVQMGKVWWIEENAPVFGMQEGGVDVLGPAFTAARLAALAKGRRDQLKGFLMDKSALDSMGNAYADETLWAAKLHPKRTTSKLTAPELAALHAAIVATITHARDTIAARKPELHEKLRDFLHVRGRKDDPCDRCGATIRTVGLHGHDAFFCPVCQRDSEARGFVDWRKA